MLEKILSKEEFLKKEKHSRIIEWRSSQEAKKFDIHGFCFICGKQQYLHFETLKNRCENYSQ